MKKSSLFIALVAVASLLASCGEKAPAFEFYGKKLTFTSVNGSKIDYNAVPTNADLTFDEANKKASGSLSCNSFFAEFELKDQSLKFSNVGGTKMSCDSASNALEAQLSEVLAKTDGYDQVNGKLLLKQGTTVLAELEETTIERAPVVVEEVEEIVVEEPAATTAKKTPAKKTTTTTPAPAAENTLNKDAKKVERTLSTPKGISEEKSTAAPSSEPDKLQSKKTAKKAATN